MTAKRLLLIDKDEVLRDTLRDQLQFNNEFLVEGVSAAEEGIEIARTFGPELVIIDICLPEVNDREPAREFRRLYPAVPIILLGYDPEGTGKHGKQKHLAEFYLTKPFKFSVLLETVRNLLQPNKSPASVNIRIGPYRFSPALNTLITHANQGTKIRLTAKESAILKYLYDFKETLVSRKSLLNEVWGYDVTATTHTVETHIYRLRQKIERNPSDAQLLRTESGGYRLTP
ncbi:MAG: response regulator transcription factor [Pseudomonadota bacterium]|nr:response regulator transcription factor [Pseudomonadota bacterium]